MKLLKSCIGLMALLLLAGCAPLSPGSEEGWARRTLRRLTLRQRIAQMMISGMNMRFINSDSRRWQKLEHLLSTDGIGGIHIWYGEASAGVYASLSSFGHTGFTGTSLWMDPENRVFVILLTNRSIPTGRGSTPNITTGASGFIRRSTRLSLTSAAIRTLN